MGKRTFEKYIPSFPANEKENRPLFFNHISKTGGTSLTGILFSIAVYNRKPYCFIPKQFGDGLKPLPKNIKESNAMVFAGESPFGFHSNFEKTFNLVTVIRNPVERIVSEYFWICRYENRRQEISYADFENYLRVKVVHNICAHYICGKRVLDEEKIQKIWKKNLKQYFAFCTTGNLDHMASWLLSRYQSASVVFNDAKKEIDSRKYDFEDKFGDQIIKYNKMDYAIYDYAQSNEQEFFLTNKEMKTSNSNTIAITNIGGKSFTFEMGKV